jgi:hypothetical protein
MGWFMERENPRMGRDVDVAYPCYRNAVKSILSVFQSPVFSRNAIKQSLAVL